MQVTYNTLIDVYGKLGRWEDALQVLQRMKAQVGSLHICHMLLSWCLSLCIINSLSSTLAVLYQLLP